MTDNKYKKMALKMDGMISDSGVFGTQPIYDEMIKVFKSQKDYFSIFKPQELLKIVIYVYSLKKTKKFDLGDKILNSGYFATIFKLHGDKYRKSCDECSGDGSVDCHECDGSGRQTCSSCEGEGDETCTQCDGSGSVEDDEGEQETCDNCSGEGKESCIDCGGDGGVSCYDCNGSGYEPCYSCDGIGEIETDEDIYLMMDIFTWNESLKSECELSTDTDYPVMTETEYDKKMENTLILHTSEEHDEFIIDLNEDNYYCCYFDNGFSNIYLDGYQFKLQLREFPHAPFL